MLFSPRIVHLLYIIYIPEWIYIKNDKIAAFFQEREISVVAFYKKENLQISVGLCIKLKASECILGLLWG